MTTAVIVALTACLTLAAAGPHLARALPPATAVRLLVPAVLLAAGASVFVLSTVTFTWLGQLAEIARFGEWSPQTLRLLDPIPVPVAVAAGAVLVPIGVWTLGSGWRTTRTLLDVHRACRDYVVGTPVVVVESTVADAFTTPGARGRIVVTTGLLRALDAGGRRVLFAHEWSHRRHRHAWWVLSADLAAALNPLLRPTAAGIRQATERWADEDAAHDIDRRQVAVTIAKVALLRAHAKTPRGFAVAAAGGEVPQRVHALLRPAPRLRARHVVTAIALILAVLAGTLAVEHTGETLFEQAMRVGLGGHTKIEVGWPGHVWPGR